MTRKIDWGVLAVWVLILGGCGAFWMYAFWSLLKY